MVALSSPVGDRAREYKGQISQFSSHLRSTWRNQGLWPDNKPLCHFLLLSPICLMPSLSSISSCTLGMSMCSRGPCGGPFTGVSKLRLFLLMQKHTHICRIKIKSQLAKTWICEMKFAVFQCRKRLSYLISISARLLASGESGEQFFLFSNY